MKFNITDDKEQNCIVFDGSISYNEIAKLKMDVSDIAILNNCPETAADCLLLMELLFRRYEEQTNAKQKS